MLISVFTGTGGPPLRAFIADGISTDSGVFGKRSAWRSISITSACRVTAQNGSKPSASMRATGSSRRSRAATACQLSGSV